MPWDNARDFLRAEFAAGETFPVTYNVKYNKGSRKGRWKVIVLPPDRVNTLVKIRARRGIYEVPGRGRENLTSDPNKPGADSINFAPTGVCQCCGR